eukprot:TRINITY_DN954_c0_g1_i11.p2 TRINITY_DN954_c0_g1~~TRINITY_DN954_c0_g1_i11.p2  ORF type:complete len:129 (+),score=25.77 TRINITY_DN954_c0_g1_i11:311-697(+)
MTESRKTELLPPLTTAPIGAKKKRIKSAGEGSRKCPRCGGWGHYQKRCKEPLNEENHPVQKPAAKEASAKKAVPKKAAKKASHKKKKDDTSDDSETPPRRRVKTQAMTPNPRPLQRKQLPKRPHPRGQ